MPHVIVKLWPGKSEHQKRRLADAITKDIATILNYGDDAEEEEGTKSCEEQFSTVRATCALTSAQTQPSSSRRMR